MYMILYSTDLFVNSFFENLTFSSLYPKSRFGFIKNAQKKEVSAQKPLSLISGSLFISD